MDTIITLLVLVGFIAVFALFAIPLLKNAGPPGDGPKIPGFGASEDPAHPAPLILKIDMGDAIEAVNRILLMNPLGQGRWSLSLNQQLGILQGEISFSEKQLFHNASVPGSTEAIQRTIYLTVEFLPHEIEEPGQKTMGTKISWSYMDKASHPYPGMMEHHKVMKTTNSWIKGALEKKDREMKAAIASAAMAQSAQEAAQQTAEEETNKSTQQLLDEILKKQNPPG